MTASSSDCFWTVSGSTVVNDGLVTVPSRVQETICRSVSKHTFHMVIEKSTISVCFSIISISESMRRKAFRDQESTHPSELCDRAHGLGLVAEAAGQTAATVALPCKFHTDGHASDMEKHAIKYTIRIPIAPNAKVGAASPGMVIRCL